MKGTVKVAFYGTSRDAEQLAHFALGQIADMSKKGHLPLSQR